MITYGGRSFTVNGLSPELVNLSARTGTSRALEQLLQSQLDNSVRYDTTKRVVLVDMYISEYDISEYDFFSPNSAYPQPFWVDEDIAHAYELLRPRISSGDLEALDNLLELRGGGQANYQELSGNEIETFLLLNLLSLTPTQRKSLPELYLSDLDIFGYNNRALNYEVGSEEKFFHALWENGTDVTPGTTEWGDKLTLWHTKKGEIIDVEFDAVSEFGRTFFANDDNIGAQQILNFLDAIGKTNANGMWAFMGKSFSIDYWLRNRLGVAAMTMKGYPAIYVDELNGYLLVQRGREFRVFEGISLTDLNVEIKCAVGDYCLQHLYNLELQYEFPDFTDVFEFLFSEKQENLVFVTGLTSNKAERELRRGIAHGLAMIAKTRGVKNVSLDDDPIIALANLEGQRPVLDNNGNWNLTLIIDEDSFGPASSERLAQLKSLADNNGIVTQNKFDEDGCSNALYISANQQSDFIPPFDTNSRSSLPIATSVEHLQECYVAILAVDHDEQRRFDSSFITSTGVRGVFAYDGMVMLETLEIVLDEFIELAKSDEAISKGFSPLLHEAINSTLGRDDLTDIQKDNLRALQTGLSYISMLLDKSMTMI
ncbi:MAG: hypothetical protein AAF702_37660 [Chloroflexota bacterium]